MNSGYTLNINLEMNYWPAGVTNLSECHQPLFKLIEEIADKGKELARDMYGLMVGLFIITYLYGGKHTHQTDLFIGFSGICPAHGYVIIYGNTTYLRKTWTF